MNKITQELIDVIRALIDKYEDAFADGELSITEIFDLISDLVMHVESLVDEAGRGLIKFEAVRDAFAYFNRKYKLVARLDEALKLPWYLEMVDGKLMRYAIDFMIAQAVSMMNRNTQIIGERVIDILDRSETGGENDTKSEPTEFEVGESAPAEPEPDGRKKGIIERLKSKKSSK